jgi:electron transfer flavoprotein beta subunit
MKICVCVKRVPMVGGTIRLTPDGLDLDTAMSGFTISPHEECAVEEAIQITARLGAGTGRPGGAPGSGTSGGPGGGGVTVLTLGPPEAADQLRDMLALGASRAILLETDGAEWGPIATAAAIADAVRADGYDLLLFGNESADTGGYQVPIRVAHALGLPCVTGIKKLQIVADPTADPTGDPAADVYRIVAGRDYRGTEELFDLPLPAVVSVKEGINLPRYPSLPGRLRAKRAVIERIEPRHGADGLRKDTLAVPASSRTRAQILGSGTGTGTDAVPALVALLDELGILP